MHKRDVWLIIFVTACILTIHLPPKAFAEGERVGTSTPVSQSRFEEYEKLRREELSMSFAFYGKVIDLDGNPVPDARVLLDFRSIQPIPTMNDTSRIEMMTDDQGRFSVERDGFLLSLEGIEKDGYEYHYRYNPKRGFRFDKQEKLAKHGQFPDQPVVFKVRKMETPTLVINDGAWFGLAPGDVAFFDLLWQKGGGDFWELTGKYKGWHPDLKVSLEGDRKKPRVVLEALDGDTGIVVDERDLYLAPQQGYRPKVLIPFENFDKEEGLNTFAYVKARGGMLFTKVRIEAGVGNGDDETKRFAEMHLSFDTNPNGEGNFEHSPELLRVYEGEVRSGQRRRFGYDPNAKPFTIEDLRRLLGK